ncbi:uncharacterized protein LOC141598417 isoform X2 [Silene latifolia]|uniref:uncharacterized protein LOC141598417 isoform X2 n=1 Tax=Silene latifolia TaxID=37657 RepID=UPI003D782C2F
MNGMCLWRLTEAFKEISANNKKNASMNKTRFYGSRAGYQGIEIKGLHEKKRYRSTCRVQGKTTWKIIQCPWQPVESILRGYYFCRYMLKIIRARYINIPSTCSMQPLGSVLCGYYVCRYMLDLIKARYLNITLNFMLTAPPSYTVEQIDDVRNIWAKFTLNFKP